MRTRYLFLAAVVSSAALGVATAAHQAQQTADRLPRLFTGTFHWSGDTGAGFTVTLAIDKVEKGADGAITFVGSHTYQPGNYKMKVTGRLDPESHRLTLTESEPSDPGSITNGSFEGILSTGLDAITCVWRSQDDGKKGDLKLTAKKTN